MPVGPREKRDFKVAFISAGSALIGALVGALVSILAVTLQLDADRDQEARERRAVAYADFLEAANTYRNEAVHAKERIAASRQIKLTLNEPALRTYLTSRAHYQASLVQVFVYGSDEAWRRAVLVGQTLPPATGVIESPNVDPAAFSQAYQGFLLVFCAEALATPRSTCTR
ncbi:hypothetical protein OG394_19505 [Kribbella sp. NBC_01245]|uniref:hypothetical protein n=1 Tax=Kribbella sp. NBC_01245 TaxID=2903578 RepID=UPI002E2D9A67|nr:hypothetical protein [Kribbella sp. NBC_01245]